MTDNQKLDFDAIAAMVFTTKAAQIAANPRFSGEGHPIVTKSAATLNLLYSYRESGHDHSRLVCLSYNAGNDKYSLVLEQDLTQPRLAVPKPPKAAVRPLLEKTRAADLLPSGCERAIDRGVQAHQKSNSGERVGIALEVGARMTVNGQNKATIISVEPVRKGSYGKVDSWVIVTDAGLTFEFENGER